MYSVTTVKEIYKDNLVLVGCSTKACESCKAEMFCNNKNDTTFTAKNENNLNLKVGDKVELFLPPGKTIVSSLLVFAVPLILFPIGYLLMKHFAMLNELICALGGIAAMAIGFAVTSIIAVRKKNELMPVITKVVE